MMPRDVVTVAVLAALLVFVSPTVQVMTRHAAVNSACNIRGHADSVRAVVAPEYPTVACTEREWRWDFSQP